MPVARPDFTMAVEEPPHKTILRDRFRARCLERAVKDRERKIKGKRRASEPSSDGPDETMDWDDEEDDDESILNDNVCISLSLPSS